VQSLVLAEHNRFHDRRETSFLLHEVLEKNVLPAAARGNAVACHRHFV